MGQGPFDSGVIEFHKLLVNLTEGGPLVFAKHVDKRGEVKGWIVADVFVLGVFGSRQVEFEDPLVNRMQILHRRNERPDILKSSASHYFGCGILQEPEIDVA